MRAWHPAVYLLYACIACGGPRPPAEPVTAGPAAGAQAESASPSASLPGAAAGAPAPGPAASTMAPEAVHEEPLVGYRAQAVGPHYKVHAAVAGPCRAGEECRIKVTLEALDGYRVSVPYPERLEVKEPTNLEPLGTDAAGTTTFSKAAGDFAVDTAHPEVGVMTVRFRAVARGTASLSALFYVAVETDKETTIARPMLSWNVAVK